MNNKTAVSLVPLIFELTRILVSFMQNYVPLSCEGSYHFANIFQIEYPGIFPLAILPGLTMCDISSDVII
jgi:hypothetical protein